VSGQGNTIAFNIGGGVLLSGATTSGDPLLGNLIFGSGPNRSGPGITLAGGADGSEPPPTVTTASPSPAGMMISGIGAARTRIEVFANASCRDPEGGRFLGATTTNGSGSWTLAAPAQAVGTGITGTQTNPTARNTSAFSRCLTAQ
jgi:hypothetical protein